MGIQASLPPGAATTTHPQKMIENGIPQPQESNVEPKSEIEAVAETMPKSE